MNEDEYGVRIMNPEDEDELIKEGWGHDSLQISKDHIEALLKGKAIGWFDGEYTHMIILDPQEV